MTTHKRILHPSRCLALVLAAHTFGVAVLAQSPLADSFNPSPDSSVSALGLQADGKILVAGQFYALGGQIRQKLGRLAEDGMLDSTFNPGWTDGYVHCLAVQADEKILVGGSFTNLAGQTCTNFGRLNSDGTFDSAFTPSPDRTVFAMAPQPDGAILIGGDFTTMAGQSHTNIARVKGDGTLDTLFSPQAAAGIYDTVVFALAPQPDGKVLAGGFFTTMNGENRPGIARLNKDGTLDTNFNPQLGYTWGGASPSQNLLSRSSTRWQNLGRW